MPTKEEVFEKVQNALVEALGVDEEEVTPEATLVGDLGAESIDFLDIVFRLERGFKVKIPRGKIIEDARGSLSESEFEKSGIVTDAGVRDEDTPTLFALPRTLVMRKVRLKNVPGGSNGTPLNAMEAL